MKNTTHLPLKRKWTGLIDKSGKDHSAYMDTEPHHKTRTKYNTPTD